MQPLQPLQTRQTSGAVGAFLTELFEASDDQAMIQNDANVLIADLQRALVKYEQSLLSIAHGVKQHSLAHKSSKAECEDIVNEIRPLISRARRTTSVGVEAFTEISAELSSREVDIQHMEARVALNQDLLASARTENESIQDLIDILREQKM